MKTIHRFLIGAFAMASVISGRAEDVKVEILGSSTAMVRVDAEAGRYLLIPVQDNGPEARVDVLTDGNLAASMVVRVAAGRVDYYVPLELEPYKGKNLALTLHADPGRDNVRDMSAYAALKHFAVSDSFSTENVEKFRPAYHHTPAYGWMNDPNGMFYHDGRWHLFFQWNPYGSKWQNMTWGHSSSTDLVNWDVEPVAIRPNGLGTIFSGSCVVDSANTAGMGKDAVIALYTSASDTQQQSMAVSTDGGTTFKNYGGNPVITLPTEARDPNMFWHEASGQWVLLLAHALEHEMLIFNSPDLTNWTLVGSFGKGLGCQDGVWECPDLMQLTDPATGEQKWVLICNINPGAPAGGSATQYFVGEFDGKKFTPDTDADGNVPTKWLDFGKDNYANVSFSGAPDGRHTIIGWMSNWEYAADVPTMQFRSANTLPRELSLFRADDGQFYVASMPSPEIDAIRGTATARRAKANLRAGSERTYSIPALSEITFSLDAAKAEAVEITLANAKGEQTVMTYDPKASTLTFDRSKSGITSFSGDFTVNSVSPTFETDGHLSLRLFIDNSSVEIFQNDGRFAMTNLVFPNSPYTSIAFKAIGGKAQLRDLNIYNINLAK